MAYADYDFYKQNYMGTVIPESSFPQVAQRASEYINAITLGKATAQLQTYENEIQMATCAVAEDYYLNRDSDKHIISESVGGHSVTYDRAITSKTKRNSCKMYLWDTGLLYTGVY